jgi:uncharacterized protein (TIGR04255 family)
MAKMKYDLENTFPTLSDAPITEALIDIRVTLPSDTTMEQLAQFQTGMEDRFGDRVERQSFEARIEFQPGNAPKVASPPAKPDGYIFKSRNEPLIAQVRMDGFTLSRLKPYHDGDTFQNQARELWSRYVESSHPLKVTRVAIRNINRLDVEAGVDLQRYILTGPEIARGLPQIMNQFLLRLFVPGPDGAMAIVTETFGVPESPGALPLIFDIDAIKEVDLDPGSEEIWNTLLTLRKFKNSIFFKSLTAESIERFR